MKIFLSQSFGTRDSAPWRTLGDWACGSIVLKHFFTAGIPCEPMWTLGAQATKSCPFLSKRHPVVGKVFPKWETMSGEGLTSSLRQDVNSLNFICSHSLPWVEFLKQKKEERNSEHRGRNWVFPRLPSCKPLCERQDCLFQPWFPGKSNRRIALMRFSTKACLSQNGWRSNEEAFLQGFDMMHSLVNLFFTKYLSAAKCVTG